MPIRFIQMLQSANDPDNASLQSVLLSVQNANQTWKGAGVQFWVRSIERYVMPHFWDMTPWASPQPWSLVKGELVGAGTPFPNAPSDGWADNGYYKTKRD